MKSCAVMAVILAMAGNCWGVDEPALKHTVPVDAKAVVIQYEQPAYIEGRALPRSGPELQILADGTIVVHDPFGRPPGGFGGAVVDPGPGAVRPKKLAHVKKIASSKMRDVELDALLTFIINEQKFFEFKVDSSKLRQVLADANNTNVTVNADGKSRIHRAYGLNEARAEFVTEENGYAQMRRIHKRLAAIRSKAIKQARTEKKK